MSKLEDQLEEWWKTIRPPLDHPNITYNGASVIKVMKLSFRAGYETAQAEHKRDLKIS